MSSSGCFGCSTRDARCRRDGCDRCCYCARELDVLEAAQTLARNCVELHARLVAIAVKHPEIARDPLVAAALAGWE